MWKIQDPEQTLIKCSRKQSNRKGKTGLHSPAFSESDGLPTAIQTACHLPLNYINKSNKQIPEQPTPRAFSNPLTRNQAKSWPLGCYTFIIYDVKEHPEDLHGSALPASPRLLHPRPNNKQSRLLPTHHFPANPLLPQPSLHLPVQCSKSHPQVHRLPLHCRAGAVPVRAGWRHFGGGLSHRLRGRDQLCREDDLDAEQYGREFGTLHRGEEALAEEGLDCDWQQCMIYS